MAVPLSRSSLLRSCPRRRVTALRCANTVGMMAKRSVMSGWPGGVARRTFTALTSLGFDPRQLWRGLKSIVPYLAALLDARKAASPDWPIELGPAFGDRYGWAGVAKGHNFHADLWAAREVMRGRFRRVVDVGSRIDGYVAHVLVF